VQSGRARPVSADPLSFTSGEPRTPPPPTPQPHAGHRTKARALLEQEHRRPALGSTAVGGSSAREESAGPGSPPSSPATCSVPRCSASKLDVPKPNLRGKEGFRQNERAPFTDSRQCECSLKPELPKPELVKRRAQVTHRGQETARPVENTRWRCSSRTQLTDGGGVGVRSSELGEER
jgi:hypothetical protein